MGRVLVIDDEAFLLDMLERYLGRLAPTDAVSGRPAATQLTQRHTYAVAVVDIALADDHGVDLIEALLAERPGCIRFVVFHTGVTPLPPMPVTWKVPHALVAKGDLTELRRWVASRLEGRPPG